MHNYFTKIEESVRYLREKVSITPKLLLVLTGGLHDFLKSVSVSQTLRAAEIPHFPKVRAEGHSGELLFGHFDRLPIAIMKGRNHYYEGLSPQEIVFPYFVLNQLGPQFLLTTNAVGGIRADLKPGDMMAVTDHINMMGTNPLIGISVLKSKNQFTSMQKAYDAELIQLSEKIAKQKKIVLKKGIYLGTPGPSYETPAEINAFRKLGADTVGMSTLFEVIAARFLNMRVLTLNIIANAAADHHKGVMQHEEVLAAIKKAQSKIISLLDGVLRGITKIA